ncbi:MAG: CopG family transcriptional regulator [Gemmatimonadales bacterium]
MPKRTGNAKRVREPLQVYLDPDERALLDRLARDTGLSRAEILRRGLKSFAADRGVSPMLEFMDSLKDADFPPDMGARHDDYLDAAYRNVEPEP